MDYLIIYLAIGLVVMGGQIAHRFRSKPPLTLAEIVRYPWIWIFGFVVFASLWPLIPLMQVANWISKRRESLKPTAVAGDRPAFEVRPDNLLRQTSIEAVEADERVRDPLGAVPDQPFGHLHMVWAAFVETLQPADELWAFEADWRPEWEIPKIFRGYAIVRDGVIVRHVITRTREIERA
jgi:hypothetical protein